MIVVRESTRAPVGTGRADPAATFERVYAAQFAPLVRLAYVTTGSLPEAEDVVQDVFASVHHRFGEIDTPVAYLRRAVLSRCTSWVRRRRLERRHAATTAGYPDGAAMPLGPEATVVRAALVRLNPGSAPRSFCGTTLTCRRLRSRRRWRAVRARSSRC